MLEKAMYFLHWGQVGMQFLKSGKKMYSVTKVLFFKKRKRDKVSPIKIQKNKQTSFFKKSKKGYAVTKAYCIYMKKLFLVFANRIK